MLREPKQMRVGVYGIECGVIFDQIIQLSGSSTVEPTLSFSPWGKHPVYF